MLEGLRRAAAAAAAAAFLQAHGHRLLTPEDTSPEVLRQLQQAAEARPLLLPCLVRLLPWPLRLLKRCGARAEGAAAAWVLQHWAKPTGAQWPSVCRVCACK